MNSFWEFFSFAFVFVLLITTLFWNKKNNKYTLTTIQNTFILLYLKCFTSLRILIESV